MIKTPVLQADPEADLRPPCMVLADTWEGISSEFPGPKDIAVNFAIIALNNSLYRRYSILRGDQMSSVNSSNPIAFTFRREDRPLSFNFHHINGGINWDNPQPIPYLLEAISWGEVIKDVDGGYRNIRFGSQVWSFGIGSFRENIEWADSARIEVELKGPISIFRNPAPNISPYILEYDADLPPSEHLSINMRGIWWANGWPTAE